MLVQVGNPDDDLFAGVSVGTGTGVLVRGLSHHDDSTAGVKVGVLDGADLRMSEDQTESKDPDEPVDRAIRICVGEFDDHMGKTASRIIHNISFNRPVSPTVRATDIDQP
ncbi:hypothetical protein Acsp04_65550 [Actinomadura sp. NBRC 104425]|nr:hypothetical protein Acsp04_65550 [Actinomadura sp. NBRC 104425]